MLMPPHSEKPFFEVDGYRLKNRSSDGAIILEFQGEFATQLQIFISEILRPDGKGRENRNKITAGIGKPGPGIAYERYDFGSQFLQSAEFDSFQLWWEHTNHSPLEGPIWTAMVEWKPGIEAFIPHGTLMQIFDLVYALKGK
jgi:hypothetical protein